MAETITLNELDALLESLSYPVTLAEANAELGDVRIQLADGLIGFDEATEPIGTDSFASAGELEAEIFNVLPREAVGEPFQSEGEG